MGRGAERKKRSAFLEVLMFVGTILVYGGLGLNGLVFWANDGRMPTIVSEEIYGKEISKYINTALETERRHQPMTDDTKLNFLADRFSFSTDKFSKRVDIYSLGDILIYIGGFIVLTVIPVVFIYNFKTGTRTAP